MSVTEAFGDVATQMAQIAPDKIVTLKASPHLSARLETLIDRKKDGIITNEESVELEQFLALDLFISLAKARARLLLTK
jgi:hypothetical protein